MADQEITLPVFYCNSVRFQVGFYDFGLLLGVTDPPLNPPADKSAQKTPVRPIAKAFMSPPHFKRFVELANQVLEGYEKQYGQIPTEKPKQAKGKGK